LFTKPCEVAEELNRFTSVDTPTPVPLVRSGAMKSHTVPMPIKLPAVSTAPSKQRVSKIFYLTAITVAMVGWLSVFGWMALAVARWLLA
jgi:hypothetical protein